LGPVGAPSLAARLRSLHVRRVAKSRRCLAPAAPRVPPVVRAARSCLKAGGMVAVSSEPAKVRCWTQAAALLPLTGEMVACIAQTAR
jgi:hypothetical protein